VFFHFHFYILKFVVLVASELNFTGEGSYSTHLQVEIYLIDPMHGKELFYLIDPNRPHAWEGAGCPNISRF
jgi:hypothetical protein